MDTLYFRAKDLFPGIILDKESEKFKIFGVSCPPNAFEFYEPLMKWFDEYFKNPLNSTALDITLDYFNTATAKFLFLIMSKLDKYSKLGHNVKIRWYYSEYDDDMKEEGEEFENLVNIDFELIQIKSETNDTQEDNDDSYFDNIMTDTF